MSEMPPLTVQTPTEPAHHLNAVPENAPPEMVAPSPETPPHVPDAPAEPVILPHPTLEAIAAALPSPPHGRFCRCPDCESARRGYRV